MTTTPLTTTPFALFFDTETTGLPDWKVPSDAPHQPHIVQIGAWLVDMGSRNAIQKLDLIVRPDGWEIPEEVVAVHGITTEYATEVGVPEDVALSAFLALWNGRMRIAHNTTFDNRIIRIATKRYCDADVIECWKGGDYECTGQLARDIMKMEPRNKYGWKMPKLSEAHEFFLNEPLTNAHNATADVQACVDIYFAIRDHLEAHNAGT